MLKSAMFKKEDLIVQPIERSETIPSHYYTHPEIFKLEKEKLFPSNWQYTGHQSQLKNKGDFFLSQNSGNPVITVKDENEIIRSFYNVCRHRGGPIAIENGSCKILQCKYHGWTYRLDGSLRGIPRFNRAELFDKNEYGLTQINQQTWNGLFFTAIIKPAIELQELLGGIQERVGEGVLSKKVFYKRIVYKVRCNWKVYVDNYLEGYHLPYVHPELCNFLDYQSYKTELQKFYSLQSSPIKKEENYLANEEGEALYYFILPNLMLNILPGRLQINLIVPETENETTVIFDYFYDSSLKEKTDEVAIADIDYSDKVQAEDIEICEHVQKGLQSRGYNKGRFSPECEQGVYHFQTLLKKFYLENC